MKRVHEDSTQETGTNDLLDGLTKGMQVYNHT